MFLNGVRGSSIVVVMLAGFVGGRLMVWFRASVVRSPDSPSYRGEGAGLALADALSFSGHSPRLWGTPLFYAVFPDDGARAFGQWAVGTLAWGLLAVVLCGQLRSMISRAVAAIAVLGLGLLPQVAGWDFAIMSESLSISLGVATLALLLWLLNGGGWPALVALTPTAFWWTFIRPEIRLMVGFVVIVLVGYAVFGKVARLRRWAVAGAAAFLVVAIGWVTAITPTMDRTYAARAWNGLSLTEATFVYRLRHQIMPNPQIMAVYQNELGMPGCPAAQRIAKGRAWSTGPFFKAYLGCPDLVAWGRQHAGSSGYRFVKADPDLYARHTLRVLPATLGGHVTGDSAVLPAPVERAAFPSRRTVLVALAAGFLTALVAAGAAGALRRRGTLVYTSLGVVVACAAAVTAELMYAAGDYSRFGIQEAVLSRIAIVMMAAAAIDALIHRLAGRDTGEQIAGHQPSSAGGNATQPAHDGSAGRPPT